MKILLFLLMSPILLMSQIQIGNDIDGVSAGDRSGHVSFSYDGTIVAIGGPGNDDAGINAGHVRVFENISGVWTQIGNSLNGDASGHNFGTSVSLSSDGTILAIGGPGSDTSGTDAGYIRVFENISGTWTQVGDDISRDLAEDRFGLFVSLSNDGTRLAIAGYTCCGLQHGTPSVGYTRIYEIISGDWIQLGEEINTGFPGISDVSLSADGDFVAIASPSGGINGWSGYYGGGVKVYKKMSGVWTQKGQTFFADAFYWGFNYLGGVSLTNNGSKLAIGDSYFIRVYEYIVEEWVQQGEDIANINFYNSKISLSDNGSIIAHGGPVTRVYENSSGDWMQLGVDINQEAIDDDYGIGIELTGDGTVLIVGAPENDGNGLDAGHARAYDLSALLSVNQPNPLIVKLYPNPAQNEFTIQLGDNQVLNQVTIYSNLGQFIQTSQKTVVNTSQFASGLYYVEIATDKGKATKKLVIK